MRHEAFATPGPVTLDIRIPAGDIEIETDDAGETAVELEARGRDAVELEHEAEISMRQRGDGYEIRVEAGSGRGLFRRSGEYRLRIAAPHGAQVNAQLASADIAGRGQYSGLDIDVASGDVQFQEITGEAKVDSASGDVQIRSVGSAKVNSASGDVQIGASAGGITANTASGDVQIGSVSEGEVRIQSASGDVRVGIAKGSRLWVDAQTLSGDTSSELELDSGEAIGSDEGPLVEVKARSMSGDIEIQRA